MNHSCWTSRRKTGSQLMCCFKTYPKLLIRYICWKVENGGHWWQPLSWIHDYRPNRRQRCIVEGCVSGWLPVTSGVPKALFLVHYFSFFSYINDIGDNLTSVVEKHKHLEVILLNWVGVVTLTKQLPKLERCGELFRETLKSQCAG